ncbi:DMT family transporter [Pseudoprimorskyibacter insulae]|uniref:Putative amino-acid metabolite efflux pump n=1 Tax=Pseudoprimorskyibacter insulae TaxID=1695997 RepID=A0A2R8AWS1_9RHOB|nr:DMT family transporter [Pseudoprimorskyibacter insulae]SPF80438.1 putative amino-acid metabolite efflux pump [Pseudoprimorskyibacter insulae]
MTQKTLSPRAWADLALLAFFWGGVFLAVRVALDEIGPLTAVLFRVTIGAAALWGIVWFKREPVPRGKGFVIGAAGMGIFNNIAPFCLMAWAQLHIPSGLTSIFNATTALFGVVLGAIAFADERLTLRKAIGVLVGFGGVAWAIGPDALHDFDLTSLAQLAVLAGTLSYAVAGIWGRKRLAGVSPLVAAAGMLTASTAILLPIALWVEGLPTFAYSAATWAAIVYYALVATALAYLLYFRVLAMAGSGNLMLVTLLIPPVAITLGALVRGETLPHSAYAGFVILTLGLAVLDGRILKLGKTKV